MKQTWKQIGSLILSVCMVLTMLPMMVFAHIEEIGSDDPPEFSGEIIDFVNLDADVDTQTVTESVYAPETTVPPEEITVPQAHGGELMGTDTVTPDNYSELEDALRSDTPKTIEINDNFTLNSEIIVGANHTLSIPSGKTIYLAGSCKLSVPLDIELAVEGGGKLVCHDTSSTTISVDGALTLNNIDFEVHSTGNQVNPDGKLSATNCNFKIVNSLGFSIASLGELEITGGTLDISNTGDYTTGIVSFSEIPISISNCNVELNSQGNNVTAIQGDMYVEDSEISIKVKGNNSSKGISYSKSLIFHSSSVAIDNQSNSTGIHSYGGYGEDSEFKIINGSIVQVEHQGSGTGIFIAPTTIGAASLIIDDSILELYPGGIVGLDLENGAKLKGSNNGKVVFNQGSEVYGIPNIIKDRGVLVTSSGWITVGASPEDPVDNAISEGEYTWNGTYFTKDGTIPAPTYTATLNIYMDNIPYMDSTPYTLKLSDSETTVTMTGIGTSTRTSIVPNGTWKVYDLTGYTGVDIVISGAPNSTRFDQYSGSYSVATHGTATGGSFDAVVTFVGGGSHSYNFDTGLPDLYYKGDAVTFTATGAGAINYTYQWSGTHGGVSIIGTGSTYAIPYVTGTIDIICTITGNDAQPVTYTVTLKANGGDSLNPDTLTTGMDGKLSSLPTPTRGGRYSFKGWFTSASGGTRVTTSTVFNANTTIYAQWTDTSGGGSNGEGPSSGGSTTAPTKPTPEKKTDQPVTVSAPVTATVGTDGTASAIISDKTITEAITKAQGKNPTEISIELNVTMPKGAASLTALLTKNSLKSLINADVTSLQLIGAPVSLEFDLDALKEIRSQSDGDISINISPAAGLSDDAKALIGNRPVYNITISTTGNGETKDITDLGNGTATLYIPYVPIQNEVESYLFGVYVDNNGNASRIKDSAYDADMGGIILPTWHFSVYGVGYTAPSGKFTDVGTNWGKESIDYVVGRGLLSGTSETTFSPDTHMTRGMLVTALGRLEEADVKDYTTNSFTDIKADSAFRPYIEWAYSSGIVQGIGNQQFAPDRAITREEIAVIFQNYAKATDYKLPIIHETTAYADADHIGSIYEAAVTAMQQAGIMTGATDNRFNPKSNATRTEVSTMLHRYIKLTINK